MVASLPQLFPGVPAVLAYTASIHWILRGKVKLDRMSH